MIKVHPTKNNLIKTKSFLAISKEGDDLLNRKREVLLLELMRYIHEIQSLKKDLRKTLSQNLENLKKFKCANGHAAFNAMKYAVRKKVKVDIMEKSVMGVAVPTVSVLDDLYLGEVGSFESDVYLDETKKTLQDFFFKLCDYISVFASVKRLAGEIQKTQRRIKALEYMFIPGYEKTVKYIEDTLEENEREEFFRRKRIKKTYKE